MVNMTIAIPQELHDKMRKHSEIKWSEIARRAIREYMDELDRLDRMADGSRLEDEDIDALDHKVKKGVARRYRKYAK